MHFLKGKLSWFENYLGIQSKRTRLITKHVLLSFLFKAGSIIANFLIVPLSIKFLNNENYGVWLTLSSFVAWFYFFDFGLGHGLRNRFAEARANGQTELAKKYVSTAYFTITLICLSIFCLSLLVSRFINWSSVFNTSSVLEGDFHFLIPVVLCCLCLQLIVGLITSIYTADQKPSIQPKVSFISALGSLAAIFIMLEFLDGSLVVFASVISLLPVVVLIVVNLLAFSNDYKIFKPSLKNVRFKYIKHIFGLGLAFFAIQFSMVIMYSTDNIIITQLLGPEEVVPYNIAFKYFNISLLLLNMILTPYWSSFTEAYIKGDIDWIKKSMNNLLRIVLFTVAVILIMLLTSNVVYEIWVGELVEVPFALSASMSVYIIVTVFYAPFNYFINGVGKVRLHMYSFLLGALINIPLSIFLVRQMDLGSKGVIIATTICILPNIVLFPLQYKRVITNQAFGLWNK